MKNVNRIVSIFLAAVLVFGTVPAVLAAESSPEEVFGQERVPSDAVVMSQEETQPEETEPEETEPEETEPEETQPEETEPEETQPEETRPEETEPVETEPEETVSEETEPEQDADEDEWLVTLTDIPETAEPSQQESSREQNGFMLFVAENRWLILLAVLAFAVVGIVIRRTGKK